MISEEGLEAVWARHAVLAGAVRAAVEAWSTPGGLELNVLDPAARSNAVTTILTGGDRRRLACGAMCQEQAGLTLGAGIGDSRAGRSASATWATSTRRWSWAPSAPSRPAWSPWARRSAGRGAAAAAAHIGGHLR